MKILVFAPFANIWVHSTLEFVVANQLKSLGHEIFVVQCGGILDEYCMPMAEAGLSQDAENEDRAKVCESCIRRSRLLTKSFEFREKKLDDYVTSCEIKEIEKAIKSVDNKNWKDFRFRNYRVGHIAAYEFLITNKINEIEFDAKYLKYYKSQLKNVCIVYLAMEKLLLEENYDAFFVFNALYSLNRMSFILAEDKGIRTFNIGPGTDQVNYCNSFYLFSNSADELLIASSDSWLIYSNTELDLAKSKSVISSFLTSTKSKSAFAYSSKVRGLSEVNVLNKLNLKHNKKNILVLLSSADERFAADTVEVLNYSISDLDKLNFKNQIEWIEFIADQVKDRDDLQLIIRVHPRLYPNKREGVLAEFAIELEEKLKCLPSNSFINWPQDEISLYDIAQVTDVAINGTSSAGVDLMMLGIPVICLEPDRLFSYPSEFNIVPNELDDLLSGIDLALKIGWSKSSLYHALKWKTFMHFEVSRNLNEAIPLRRRWTLLRVLNGLKVRKAINVPVFILEFFERAELKGAKKIIKAQKEIGKLLHSDLSSFPELKYFQKKFPNEPDDFDLQRDLVKNEMMLANILETLYFKLFNRIPTRAEKIFESNSQVQ